jgi:hypothetical protein
MPAFSAPPQSQRPGQGPRSPHPKAGPGQSVQLLNVKLVGAPHNQKVKVLLLVIEHVSTPNS